MFSEKDPNSIQTASKNIKGTNIYQIILGNQQSTGKKPWNYIMINLQVTVSQHPKHDILNKILAMESHDLQSK